MRDRETASVLIERERELDALERRLVGARTGGGGAVLIEGEPGIGKTALLAAGRFRAEASGMLVLQARGAPLEREYAFGALAGLLRPAADMEPLQAAPAAVRRLLEPDGEGAPPVEPSRMLLDGIFRVVEGLCQTTPVVLCLDDAHWMDRETLLAAAYLAHRAPELPLAMLIARRPAEGPEDPRGNTALLEPVARAADTVRLTLRRLSPSGAAALARQAGIGPAQPDDELLFAITGGNPMLVGHVANGLAHLSPPSGAVVTLTPTTMGGIVLERLLGATPAARAVAQAVATLGDGETAGVVAEVAELEPTEALTAAAELEQVAMFNPAEPFSFAHPLLAEVVRGDLGSAAQGLLHLRACHVLRGHGAGVNQLAGQLLRCPPTADPAAVADLRAAAAHARARAAPQSAVTLLERALREPPAPDVRPAVEIELGQAQLAAGEIADAMRRLEPAIHDPVWPVDVALEAAVAAMVGSGFVAAVEAMLAAARARERSHPDDALMLRGTAAYTSWFLPPTHRPRVELPDPATLTGATRGERMALTGHLSQRSTEDGLAQDSIALARRALADGRLIADSSMSAEFAASPLLTLVYAEDLITVEREVATLERVAVEQAWPGAMIGGRLPCALLLLAAGDPAAAIAECRALLDQQELAPGTLRDWLTGFASGMLLLALLDHEGGAVAEAALSDLGLAGELAPGQMVAASARAHVRLANGRPEDALADARAWQIASEAIGDPLVPIDFGTALPLALLACGELDEARERGRERLIRAERWGAPARIAAHLRVQARIEPDRAVSQLERAAELSRDSPLRLERARVLLDLGVAQRRAGQRSAARDTLERAVQAADECTARPLAESALQELRVLGARPRRLAFSGVASLTASERRVCELAAAGATNRQIAQRLFVTVKTVDSHLMRAYRKLAISSRRELPAVLSGTGGETSG